jgi:uncharacterized protein (DUF1800 family)
MAKAYVLLSWCLLASHLLEGVIMAQGPSPSLDGAIAVSRFGLGARPGELQACASDPRGWLTAQIQRAGADQPDTPLPGSADRFAALISFRDQIKDLKQGGRTAPQGGGATRADGTDFKRDRRMAVRPLLEGVRDEIFARTRLGAGTAVPFRERWALFWANHFTVSTARLQSALLAGPFEREAIRPNIFGRFEDLLVASTTHPGMLVYLDQARSAGPDSMAGTRRQAGLNENLAREIMELHTIGADAGYTQADVTEFARALTGYSIGTARDAQGAEGRFLFRANLHEPGARTVLGKHYGEDGAQQARTILRDLAASPHTATHVARKLATHFVADTPPPALIARLRASYLKSDGDLALLAKTLVESPEAWSAEPEKFKTPNEFVLSSYRAVGAAPSDPAREVVQPLTAFGQRPYAAPQPNGWSDLAGDWAAPDALVKRLTWASQFSGAYAPGMGTPIDTAEAALGARMSTALRTALARAESRVEAFTILLMSAEFQRR